MPFLLLYVRSSLPLFSFFFFNDTATTEIYTLSLHDALPISAQPWSAWPTAPPILPNWRSTWVTPATAISAKRFAESSVARSEEHTSELQSHLNLVCRLLLEKKKNLSYIVKVTLFK